ncbi:MAG TPA: MraY family glycosyltransferase [Phycisphaerae bacterium]|nr:MraY family glycosyltransferase [Phycisphaerae bacterium]
MLITGIFLLIISLVLSLIGTEMVGRYSARLGLMDHPGERKIHSAPIPRSGGVAIFWSMALPIGVMVALAGLLKNPSILSKLPPSIQVNVPGLLAHRPLAFVLLMATLAIHILGLRDDMKALSAPVKLFWQILIAAGLVIGGEIIEPGGFRILTMLDHLFPGGAWVSGLSSVTWIVLLTNAFNFMDNMDGLSAGVAAICATMFFIAALLNGQWFICGLLLIYLGAVLGFLWHNFPPAKIFMGDGGSMVLGFFLAALTIRTTYYSGEGRWYAVLMPLMVTAVPLYDLIVVCLVRLRKGRSPMVGDTNHFSHRLARQGFSKRGAVLVIYAVTLSCGLAAPLLARADAISAVLIAAQCLSTLTVVGILERVGEHTQ